MIIYIWRFWQWTLCTIINFIFSVWIVICHECLLDMLLGTCWTNVFIIPMCWFEIRSFLEIDHTTWFNFATVGWYCLIIVWSPSFEKSQEIVIFDFIEFICIFILDFICENCSHLSHCHPSKYCSIYLRTTCMSLLFSHFVRFQFTSFCT